MNIVCVSIVIGMTGLMGFAETYPILNQAIKLYTESIQFLNNMMSQDRLWQPILEEKIKMIDLPRNHLDHFNAAVVTNETPKYVIVDTFKEVTDLMMTQSKVGKDVAFVMQAVKNSLSCLIMKHISLQGFLLHHLILKANHPEVISHMVGWLDHMLLISIDKLVAMDQRLPTVMNMHSHVQQLAAAPNNISTENDIQQLSQNMYNQLGEICEVSETMGHYETLILKLKKSMSIEELDSANSLLTEDNTKNIYEVKNITSIKEYHGSLNIAENINPEQFDTLNENELKKILIVNKIKMNSTFSNLPVNALSVSQWNNIFHLNKMPIMKDSQNP